MYVLGELSAFMPVAEEVTDDSEDGSYGLDGDVPFRSYYLGRPSACVAKFLYSTELHTPSTIPVGKMMPHAKDWIKMCVHSIES